MKIGVITIHFGINYGSALQAYALTYYLKNKYKNVTLINYVPQRYGLFNRYKKIIKRSGLIKGILKIILGFPSMCYYDHLFYSFLKNNTPLSSKVVTHDELVALYGDYEVLIAGSDQIWNADYNEGFDGAYYLSFAGNNTKSFAYAASCGIESFYEAEIPLVIDLLNKMDGISVRESMMIPMLSSLGIDNANLVLDPVLLVDKSAWTSLLNTCERIIKDRYLLIYILEEDTGLTVDHACNIADCLNLKTVMVSFGHLWSNDRRIDYYLKYQNPIKFLNLMYYADYVVTNSFHGMAFSIVFNKQYFAFERKKYNSRLESLSKLFHLENRLVSSNEDLNLLFDQSNGIDYREVNILLENMKKQSEKFLNQIVE